MHPLTSTLACQQVAPLARKLAKASAEAKVSRIRRQCPGNWNLVADVQEPGATKPVTVIVTALMIKRATSRAQQLGAAHA